ncbi:putative Zn finger protein [Pullulanibacillus pueri]|uniref:SWIM-type domain-containing protein n=1 Tax=Pullulanibacillus pueri TaxID=1437324 RepID=A0A8J2ZW64_9BACL|nr:SWIM zinc finger family protein [Pullulanibacillus pueri]MBM7682740.1 putative Zn finger protein [Pullulanibacillus pueri]GGH83003.1 hypothetical protein GCM10007096_23230 [Pullulanibacillus pueri]
MIHTLEEITTNKALKQWLDRFFSRVDTRRTHRGLELYRNRAVTDFQDKIFGFTASVKGSKKYNVSAFFEGVNKAGLPHLDKALFICSCPDDVICCKHVVAAVIHWAVDFDTKKKDVQKLKSSKSSLVNQRFSKAPALKALEKLATKEEPVAFSKESTIDWVFHPPIAEVMDNIHKIVKKGV